jgi:hypothetical protein
MRVRLPFALSVLVAEEDFGRAVLRRIEINSASGTNPTLQSHVERIIGALPSSPRFSIQILEPHSKTTRANCEDMLTDCRDCLSMCIIISVLTFALSFRRVLTGIWLSA